jgi:hypothetical protein
MSQRSGISKTMLLNQQFLAVAFLLPHRNSDSKSFAEHLPIMVFEPFSILSVIIGGMRLGWTIVKAFRGKKKEDEIRRAELRLSEKMANVLAALEAHERLAFLHVGSFAKRDGTIPGLSRLTLRYFTQSTAGRPVESQSLTLPRFEKDQGGGEICSENTGVL